MCGILGGCFAEHNSSALDTLISRAQRSMLHRGPDAQGCERHTTRHDAIVALAHNRLSIIDLSPAGRQPMHDPSGRYTIVFNGEVYNYVELREDLSRRGHHFTTRTDTEVLLTAWGEWGEACLPKLAGMFAFVVYDRLQETLTCVRDPFGIKPLYYSLVGADFYFASELPALLTLLDRRPRPNLQRAHDYLVYGDYDSSADTFVENVRHLLPGHLMTVAFSESRPRSQVHAWWDARKVIPNRSIPFHEATRLVRDQFLNNVRLHLRSDVPLGVALSGGIDSASIVCAIKHLDPTIEVRTFSYIAAGTSLSEEPWVDIVNDATASIPHKTQASCQDLLRDLEAVVAAQGEPFGSTSIYAQYRVFELAKRHGVTVTLDGQGADELLAGYIGYPGERLLSLVEGGQFREAISFLRRWAQLPGRRLSRACSLFLRETLPAPFVRAARRLLRHRSPPRWLNARRLRDAGVVLAESAFERSPEYRRRRVTEKLAYSLQRRGLPELLRHEDRNAMRFSLESRVPFLTPALTELLLSLPEEYLISPSGTTKHVFREAMRGIVPNAVLDRKDKVGFATPEKDWLLLLAPQLRDYLADCREIDFIDSEVLPERFDQIVMERRTFSWQVWRWLNYVIWYRRFILSSPT